MSTVVAFDIGLLRDDDLDRLGSAVSAERRARAARFRFVDDQKRCLAAGVLLRYALASQHGISIHDVDIATNEFGKPFLADRPGLHFNLSHAGAWVICATSASVIGVDIERSDARHLGIARRFAPDEYAYITDAPAREQPRRFVQIWTLKESYAKYVGRGLRIPMDSFSVSPEHPHPKILRGEQHSRPFLKHVAHGGDYSIAECCDDDSPITVNEVATDDLWAVC